MTSDCPLVVEVQSEAYHSALVDKQQDEQRLAALRAAGFEVVEVTDEQVWHHPDEVVAAVRRGSSTGCSRRRVTPTSTISPAVLVAPATRNR